jgi:hypothetical protein
MYVYDSVRESLIPCRCSSDDNENILFSCGEEPHGRVSCGLGVFRIICCHHR